MNSEIPTWQSNIAALLKQHGYTLEDSETVSDLCARTGLDKKEVQALLSGDRSGSIEALCRLAAELHVPPGELLNSNPSLARIYSIDGSAPVTVVLPPHLTDVSRALTGSLLYAGGLDGSYAKLPSDCLVICTRGGSEPVPGILYLLENDRARFVRRCVSVNHVKHEALMSNDSDDEDRPLAISCGKVHVVTSETPLIVGTVLFSVMQHLQEPFGQTPGL